MDNVCARDAIITTNVLAARATWDLQKYKKRGNYIISNENNNKWASAIAHCLFDCTNKITGFVVGYKEEDISSPMVLCVNGFSVDEANIVPAIKKTRSYQNLGYAY